MPNVNFSRTNPHNDMNNPNSFPIVPSSLSTGDYGMRGDYAAQGAPDGAYRNAPHTLEDVRPYLGPRSRLSQVWINRWTILILLVLVRVLIAIGSLRSDIDDAKSQALSACHSVESIGSNMASMPHYLSDGVNDLAAMGVTKAVSGLRSGLFDVVSAAEAIFVFWVNMVFGMYECLITFAVTGALHGVVSFGTDASNFLNSTLHGVGDDIGKALDGFNDALQSFENAFNDVASVFTGKTSPPAKLDLSSEVNTLDNLSLPSSVTDDLQKLNGSIPNFDQVKNFTDTVLRAPFEEVKKLMNEHLGNYTFDKTVLPVPQRTQLTFCSDNQGIDDFFVSLYKVADDARKIFIATLLLAAVIACVPMGYLEIRRWRSMKQYASRSQAYAVDGIDGVYIASRPWTAYGGIKVSQRFNSSRARNLSRWFVAYITSIPALVLLSLALAGLFSCLCQYLIIRSVEKEVPALAQDVTQYADKIIAALNNASAQWANGANGVINDTQTDINNKMLGWVNTTTSAVNDTLNTFVNETITVLNATFGGTILYEPILDVYQCLIGLKIAGIEKGLTWVSDHAYVEFPMFPNNTFAVGSQASITTNTTTVNGENNSFLADPTDGASDKVTAVVTKLGDKLMSGIRTETLLATALLVFYLILVLMGLARVAWSMMFMSKSRGEGGVSYAGDVQPGMTEDNTNQAAVANQAHGYSVAPTPIVHQQTAQTTGTASSAINPAAGGFHESGPPPTYEPPAKSSNGRRRQFQGAYVEEEEEAYQNEKMGFPVNSGGSSMQRSQSQRDSVRESRNNPFEENNEKRHNPFI